ncbi:MAG: PIN domain-containing protein [Chloroflexota bacterium]
MILIDTDVMVDVMREYEPALTWLEALGSAAMGIPGLVAMELLQGCRDREEKQEVEALLGPYPLYWPTPADCARALDDFSSHHLSQGLGILDALIAETAVGCNAQLATFNQKHYRVVDALQMIQPYARS